MTGLMARTKRNLNQRRKRESASIMASTSEQDDALFELISDALRSGPGTPAWHEALRQIKQRGGSAADDYKLLMQTREHLESGREYRSVRAGPEFTRKVLHAIDQETSSQRLPSATATVIAILGGLLALVALVAIGQRLISANSPHAVTLADLQDQTFTHEQVSASFTGPTPAGWNHIGSLPLLFDHAMQVDERAMHTPAATQNTETLGGGIYAIQALPADQPLALEITLQLGGGGPATIPQAFISDNADFSDDRGISAHEFTWSAKPDRNGALLPQVFLPGGELAQTMQADALAADNSSCVVRISLAGNFALVDCAGKRIYAGPSGLSAGKPRYAGVRFLRLHAWSKQTLRVQSVRILQP